MRFIEKYNQSGLTFKTFFLIGLITISLFGFIFTNSIIGYNLGFDLIEINNLSAINYPLKSPAFAKMDFLMIPLSGFSIFDIFFKNYGCVRNELRCNENNIELCVDGDSWRTIKECENECRFNQCIVS